jgi:hypothetical protein
MVSLKKIHGTDGQKAVFYYIVFPEIQDSQNVSMHPRATE